MQRVWMHIGWIVMVMLLLLGCSDDHQEIPTTKSGQKLYHEIDDPFEFYGAESGLPFEVMVEEIWMEDFAEHEDYISEHVHHPDESRALMFISYQVTNKGDRAYPFTDDRFYPNNDVLPNLINPNNMIFDVDIAYPEDGVIDDMEQVTDLIIEPGETMDITGAVITYSQTEYDGAFMWDYDADIPQTVFTRSQSKRKDQVGVYDIGDPVYVMDQNGMEFNVIFNAIHDVKSDEEMEEIEREYDHSAFLVLDMIIENSGEKDMAIPMGLPEITTNGHHAFERSYFIKKGEMEPIKDIYINPGERPTDGLIKPGETVEGTLYYEVKNSRSDEVMTVDAHVYYPYLGFEDYAFYKQVINYNLD